MDRRSGSFPLPGRNGQSSSSSASHELQAHLSRRLRIVEGGCSTPVGPARTNDGSASAPVGPPVRQLRSVSPAGPQRSAMVNSSVDLRSNASQGTFANAGNSGCSNSGNRPGPAQGSSLSLTLSPRSMQQCSSSTPTPRSAHQPGSNTPTPRATQAMCSGRRGESPMQRQGHGPTTGPLFRNILPPDRIRRHMEPRHQGLFSASGDSGGSHKPPTEKNQWLTDLQSKRFEPFGEKPSARRPPSKDGMVTKAEYEALKREKVDLEDQFKKETEALKLEKADLAERLQKESEARITLTEQMNAQQAEALDKLQQKFQHLQEQNELWSKMVEELSKQQQTYNEERASLLQRVQELEFDNSSLMQAKFLKEEELSERTDLLEENRRLSSEITHMRTNQALLQERQAQSTTACSESRLRSAMALPSTSTEELLLAVTSVEALLGEARREVASRQHRERRAAYERLHNAMEKKADETILAAAIAEATRCGIDAEDIAKAQTKLDQLQSLTDEQRAEKAAQELKTKIKAEAYQLVKKDDGDALLQLLDGLQRGGLPATCWQDWRDYAGRSLRQFAKEMRSSNAQRSLSELFERQQPQEAMRTAVATPEIAAKRLPEQATMPALPSAAKKSPLPPKSGDASTPVKTVGTSDQLVKPTVLSAKNEFKFMNLCEEMYSEETTSPASDATISPPSPADTTPKVLPVVAPEEEAALKQQALRAVVQDDVARLSGVLDRLPVEIWSVWTNKAGKDLVTLSQERGSTCAYSLLARALGWLKEQKREVFEEREAVWVLVKGELQPRQATVIEDTPEEADHILVEYWDDNEPPSYVERALVLKSCAR